MPIQPTYPGVYIEEVPSGVRTITGVATSITAFIGRALKGPVDEPTVITSYSDFERQFGGLWAKSMLSYAVKDFYLNGGSIAVIVRVHNSATASSISVPTTASPAGTLTLKAASLGAWGAKLQVSIDHETKDTTNTKLFNLKVSLNVDGGSEETYLNVSTDEDDARYLPRVLKQSSSLIEVEGSMPAERPAATETVASPPTSPLTMIDAPISATGGGDGSPITKTEVLGSESLKTGIYALTKADLFNLLCIPPATRDGDTDPEVYQAAMKLCADERAILLVDPPKAWGDSVATAAATAKAGFSGLGLTGTNARNAALYFPRVKMSDSLRDNQTEVFVPSGIIAGIISKTDRTRGIWKSPAGNDAALSGIQGLQVNLTDAENGQLNPLGINCLRNFPVTGRVVWGARTLRGADQLADEYKYLSVRRTALYIEESLFRGTQWVVFEPNDEPLWAQIRLNVGAFMQNLFKKGAFQGSNPKEAYMVKCDSETTTQNDINLGIVNIHVGFAPLKPAEFVFIKIQQLTGNLNS